MWVCVHVHIYGLCTTCMHMCMCVHMLVCAHIGGQRLILGVFSYLFFLRQVCHWAYLPWIGSFASRSSRVCLSLAHHHWGFRPVQSCLIFAWMVGSELRSSCICSKALYLLRKPSPQSRALHPKQSAPELPLDVWSGIRYSIACRKGQSLGMVIQLDIDLELIP